MPFLQEAGYMYVAKYLILAKNKNETSNSQAWLYLRITWGVLKYIYAQVSPPVIVI